MTVIFNAPDHVTQLPPIPPVDAGRQLLRQLTSGKSEKGEGADGGMAARNPREAGGRRVEEGQLLAGTGRSGRPGQNTVTRLTGICGTLPLGKKLWNQDIICCLGGGLRGPPCHTVNL